MRAGAWVGARSRTGTTAPALGNPSAALSTVIVDAATIANDGTTPATITVTLKAANGTLLAGLIPTASCTNPTNTTISAFTVSDINGVSTGTLVSTNATTHQVTVVANTVTITQTVTVTVTGAGGIAPTLTLLSRDAGARAGGQTILMTGTNINSSGLTASFNGVGVSSVSFISATQVAVVNPPYSGATVRGGAAVDVILTTQDGSSKLTGGFEYHPQIVTSHISDDFESGNLSKWPLSYVQYSGGTVKASNETCRTGTYSCKCSGGTSNGGASAANLEFIFPASYSNAPFETTNGLYARWYQMIPNTSLSLVTDGAGHQMKVFLYRVGGTQVAFTSDGYLMAGVGGDFPPGDGSLNIYDDATTGSSLWTGSGVTYNRQSCATYGTGRWVKHQVWLSRYSASGASTSQCKVWIDDKIKYNFSNYSRFGSDGAALDYRLWLGIPVGQCSSGSLSAFLDEVQVADGYCE